MEEIKCPKCLKGNDVEKLEHSTEYSCWTGEEVWVECLHCDFGFEVKCEHRGYEPVYDCFDMDRFIAVHDVKVPETCSDIWVIHYFRDFV